LNLLPAFLDQWSRSKPMSESVLSRPPVMSADAFAVLGGSKVAYVKAIRSEDVPFIYPRAPQLAPGLALFALHAADGTPMMITDSREAAIAGAACHDLDTVSVH
jgi:hypothetical protein